MLRRVVSFSLLLGIARSSSWPHQPCTLDAPLLAMPLCFVGIPASITAVSKSASRQQQHRPVAFRSAQQQQHRTSTQRRLTSTSMIHARQCSHGSSSSSRGPQTTGNPHRQRTCQPEHANPLQQRVRHTAHPSSSTSTSLSITGRRTELGTSPSTSSVTAAAVQHHTSRNTINAQQYSSSPQTTSNPLRPRASHPEHTTTTTTTSLSMGRRTELGASPWKTDSRTVQEWLEFSERELRKINKVLGPPRAGRDIGERLGLLADGKTDSVVMETHVRRGNSTSATGVSSTPFFSKEGVLYEGTTTEGDGREEAATGQHTITGKGGVHLFAGFAGAADNIATATVKSIKKLRVREAQIQTGFSRNIKKKCA